MNHFEFVMENKGNFVTLANAIELKGWAGESELVLLRVGYNAFSADRFDALCDQHGFPELKGKALQATAFRDPEHFMVYAIYDRELISRSALQKEMYQQGQLTALIPD